MSTLEERQMMKRSSPRVVLDAIHTQHCHVVPTRNHMLDLMLKGGIVAEIGAAEGDFTQEILNRSDPQQLHLIDAWQSARYQHGLEAIKTKYRKHILEGRLIINRGLSTKRLALFDDDFFDWVYIDTDHTYPTTRDELTLCLEKVKPTGRIAGHDFTSGNPVTPWPYGVIEACNEFCVKNNWEFEFLSLESHGHFSFCLKSIQ